MTTTFPSEKSVQRNWILVDAKGQVLGRLASRIALVLRGKDKASFTPFIDTGDFVIVINASQVSVSGRKPQQKLYQRYSGYPGGRRVRVMEDVLKAHPDRVIRQAVKGMMPDGPLSRQQLKKLKIYNGAQHPHGSQQPAVRDLTGATK